MAVTMKPIGRNTTADRLFFRKRIRKLRGTLHFLFNQEIEANQKDAGIIQSFGAVIVDIVTLFVVKKMLFIGRLTEMKHNQ
jgi:hypothetical protein